MVSIAKMAWMAQRPLWALKQIRRVKALQAYPHEISDEPRMPGAVVEGLRELLRGATLMVEYGAGGSTILAGRMGVNVISVEGDHNFADAVIRAAAEHGLTNVQVLKAELGWTMDWSYPFDRFPSRTNVGRWRRYVELPWVSLDGAFPDFVLVDGRLRKACVARSVLECVRRGARIPIVLDDYLGRPGYAAVQELTDVATLWDRTAVLRIKKDVTASMAEAALDRWIEDLQ